MNISYKEIIKFWFEEISPKQHWVKDQDFDNLIRTRFGQLHQLACIVGIEEWRTNPESSLAEIIILDQFSRNIYRDDKRAFENDDLALKLSMEAINKNFDTKLDKTKLLFLYMPFMHSEDKEVHKKAVELFERGDLDLEYEYKHKEIIDRFGRYPHRNKILGRESTLEELEFLKESGSSF